jgi:sugar phosphate isomerase/epimerase
MKKTFITLTIITMGIFLFSSCSESSIDKEIGVQLWSVRDAMPEDPAGTLQALADMGYTFVEAAGYSNGKFYGMEPQAFRELVESTGMVFLGSHSGHAVPDDENREDVMDWWEECIQAHAAAGVKYIVQPWMSSRAFESIEGLQAYCDYFNEVGEKCNQHGIRFGFHNHAEEFNTLNGTVIYDYMLQNTDPEKVMFQIDLYWAYIGNADPVTYFERYPGRFEGWHVKDVDVIGASGKIDFERIFQYADISGLKDIVVEFEHPEKDPFLSLDLSMKYLVEAEFVK